MTDDVRADARRLLARIDELTVFAKGAEIRNDGIRAERDAALAVIAQVRDLATDVDQDGGHSGPSLARHILNIIGGEA